MRNNKTPDPNVVFPVEGFDTVTYVKPIIKRPNIIVGDFTYFSDTDFESHVTHHYDFCGDKLIIGKFCQIGKGVEFIMNGANHQMNAISTFPFYILEGWEQEVPPLSKMPIKGDTIVGNDVWIGQNVTIMPGVIIGDGAIIGANSVVAKSVDPYTIVAGNPAKPIRKRFDDELIELMLKFKWWNKEIDEINSLIPLLSDNDTNRVKQALKELL
ncbi:MAG: chloramphenicol acetyltransferase [Bacteroidales bacterium 45-6]|uniref:CatB-related O-acetyltransferase n=1 Tax=uncultured Dysgonomonas sp. TaxID=206096 RepID=UPI0009599FD4|nr:CatB-related O-acetyltransferase [uncultured Dysgonomonas sp.]OJU48061.1 MAG: chloramphenicol acetyltransferase [Bacteroidales bacterium 45-6]